MPRSTYWPPLAHLISYIFHPEWRLASYKVSPDLPPFFSFRTFDFKMHFTKLLSLVFFATLASYTQAASNDCCDCFKPNPFNPGGFCADGTMCTPYCGYGPCNIFGCNCDGGCRVPAGRKRARSFAHTDLAATSTTEDRFNAADTNNDGQLTFEEWAASDQNKNTDKNALAEHWAKFDSANVGYLTKADATSRIA
ncbi:hypothetical protein BD779DRAFT_1573267 [Infundibulicybe gibba]|nr:hypothetical protein BD779DRAFT_1573267 [Infundibulicybe gibba]